MIPVELNSILYRYELNMALFQTVMRERGLIDTSGEILDTPYSVAHNVAYYEVAARNRSHAMRLLLWNNTVTTYQDYNLTAGALNTNSTSISSFIPMWAGLFDTDSTAVRTQIYDRLVATQLIQTAGVLTTNFFSGQQWDAPNAWPPLVWFTIEGLVKLALPQSVALAVRYFLLISLSRLFFCVAECHGSVVGDVLLGV